MLHDHNVWGNIEFVFLFQVLFEYTIILAVQ